MSKVTAQMSVSLDGCYAGPQLEVEGLSMDTTVAGDWMASAEASGFFRVTRWATEAMAWRERQGFAGGEQDINSDIIAETMSAPGAYVMGRRMADGGEVPWGEEPPFRAPVFVVTHRRREVLHRLGGTSFTYVTDGIASAVDMARSAADGRDVAVAGGGQLLRQVIELGLLDELELHIAPVVIGEGMRLLDGPMGLKAFEGIELTPLRVLHTPTVTHLRYRIEGRSALVLDDRGSGGGRTELLDGSRGS
jgi:dihydrofolate reductase